MKVFSSVAEIDAARGETLGPTDWLTIDQSRIDMFADATGDHQWIHVDPKRAASGPFGSTIAHGFLTLSLVAWAGQQLISLEVGSARLNYGINKVRFPTAVKVGEKVRGTARIAEVMPHAAGDLVVIDYTITTQGAERPACVAQTATLLLR